MRDRYCDGRPVAEMTIDEIHRYLDVVAEQRGTFLGDATPENLRERLLIELEARKLT